MHGMYFDNRCFGVSLQLGWFPVQGYVYLRGGFGPCLAHLLLPALGRCRSGRPESTNYLDTSFDVYLHFFAGTAPRRLVYAPAR